MATTERIELPSVEDFAAAEKALQAAFDHVEKATYPLRRLSEYDPADWQETLTRAPVDADVTEAFSFLDAVDAELYQLKRDYDDAVKGLHALNMARLEARRA